MAAMTAVSVGSSLAGLSGSICLVCAAFAGRQDNGQR
jgi:hypothetical protein